VIVLDASVVLDLLLRSTAAKALEERMFAPGESLHAPHLIDLEIAQVLRRYWLAGELTAIRAGEAFEDLAALPLQRYGHEVFLGRIWELRNNVTAYDAAYLALAEVLGAPLLTRDKRLAAASGHHAIVELS
jgi:predicted nucleic acid-binding protein